MKRLSLAIERGEFELPEPPVLVINASDPDDAVQLGLTDATFIQGFAPHHLALKARLDKVVPDMASATGRAFAGAIVMLPKSRDLGRYWLSEARTRLKKDAPIIVEGDKTLGIDACLKWCRQSGADVGPVFAKAHGKVFATTGGSFDSVALERRTKEGYRTNLGIFSADAVDPGSFALAQALPEKLTGAIADLGAGWGYLSGQALKRDGVEEIHLVEAEWLAVAAARENILDKRAVFHWTDATTFSEKASFDHVICNPPFHKARAGDPGIGRAFISSASRLIHPRGTVWLVANRHLPYEKHLTETFGEVSELVGPASYKLFQARKPIKSKT